MRKSLSLVLFLLFTPICFAYEVHRFFMEVIYVDNLWQIPVNAKRLYTVPPNIAAYRVNKSPPVLGEAHWTSNHKFCRIFVLKPKGEDDMFNLMIAGHETLHCTDGHFHPPTIK